MKKALIYVLLLTVFVISSYAVTIPEMVLLSKGSFMMGSDEGEADEKPFHKVSFDYDFYIGKYEITNKQFMEFLNDANVSSKGILNGKELIILSGDDWGKGQYRVISGNFILNDFDKGNYPARLITWWGAMEYCNWLSEEAGLPKAYDKNGNLLNRYGKKTTDPSEVKGYRLPTEAEWEYTAKGGKNKKTSDLYYVFSGSNELDVVGWYRDNCINKQYPIYSGRGTHKVGSKKANEKGIYDMSGNLWEWCHDFYSADFYKTCSEVNPVNNTKSDYRIRRGGGWPYETIHCRVTNRGGNVPTGTDSVQGFRVVRTK